jgi:hypothetical protein
MNNFSMHPHVFNLVTPHLLRGLVVVKTGYRNKCGMTITESGSHAS